MPTFSSLNMPTWFSSASPSQLRNLSEKIGKGICPECLAGVDDTPYEDFSWHPVWDATQGLELPWNQNDPSPLLDIPGRGDLNQHQIFRKDPFHIFKQTVGGHWVASSIVLLLDLGYWSFPGESNQADNLLENAYRDFHYFMKNEWQGHQVANIKMFTRAVLHWPRIKVFPFGRFKGSDTMLMIRWLAQVVSKGRFVPTINKREGINLGDKPHVDWHKPFLRQVLKGCISSVEFFRILHNQGVWLSRQFGHELATHCFEFVSSYSLLARMCHAHSLRRFMLEPSLHYFHHYAIDLTHRLQKNDKYLLSPNQDNCESDEDFVGRLARLSRSAHALTTNIRTLQRYRIKLWFVLKGEDWGASRIRRKKKLTRVGRRKKKVGWGSWLSKGALHSRSTWAAESCWCGFGLSCDPVGLYVDYIICGL